jgi:pyruvate,water dikinase
MIESFLYKMKNFVLRQGGRDDHLEYDRDLVEFFMGGGYDQLKQRYASFNKLLVLNSAAMDALNALQEEADSHPMTFSDFKQQVAQLLDRLIAFARSLIEISGDKYAWLMPITEGLKARIEKKLAAANSAATDLLVPFRQVGAAMADEVGAKASNLGEVKNILHLPVPRGLVFTFLAYRTLISHNRLDEIIRPSMADLTFEDSEKIRKASARIQQAILAAEIPPDLKAAAERKLEELGEIPWFAVRSSAVGEDGADSFAGQFRSALNVPRNRIFDGYKDVCASLFEERAIRYRLSKGIPHDENAAMAVLVLEMVPVFASGVLYTLDPGDPESDRCVVTAVLGLGKYAVDGTVQPDVYLLDRKENSAVLEQTVARKHLRLTPDFRQAGVKSEEVPSDLRQAPCMDKEALHRLYGFSRIIERHFKTPQDVEWAIDEQGRIFILQTRPLAVAQGAGRPVVDVNETPVLVGNPLNRGVVSGPAIMVREKGLTTVPAGSVLVLKTMDPEFAKLVPQAGGMIVEMGSAATHLATVAREFHKPTLINAADAMTVLTPNEIVTLDANQGKVYRGRIKSLLKTEDGEKNDNAGRRDMQLPLIKNVMKNISPLTLTDIPENPMLEQMMKPGDFKTVHDVIRYIHEISVREVFRFGGRGKTGAAHHLQVPELPLHFHVIDVGGGLDSPAVFKRNITVSDIVSPPFIALWKGMTCEDFPWSGSVEFNLDGFFSVVSRSFVQGGVTGKGGNAYVLLSGDYLNFHSRLAYHFSVIDTLMGKASESNYLTFRFGGGGADVNGRIQRAQLLEEILQRLDFSVNVVGDTVTSRFRGGTRSEIEKRLYQLGRLMGFTRQLDMTLRDERTRKRYAKAFL